MGPSIIEEMLNVYLRIVLSKSTKLIISVSRTYQCSELEIYEAQKEMIQKNLFEMDMMLSEEYKSSYHSQSLPYEEMIDVYFRQHKEEMSRKINYTHYKDNQIPDEQKRPLQWEKDRIDHKLSFQTETTYGPLNDRYSYNLTNDIRTSLQEAITFSDLHSIVGNRIHLEVLSFYDNFDNVVGIIDLDEKYIQPIPEFQDDKYTHYNC